MSRGLTLDQLRRLAEHAGTAAARTHHPSLTLAAAREVAREHALAVEALRQDEAKVADLEQRTAALARALAAKGIAISEAE
jgi:hypothetical protein